MDSRFPIVDNRWVIARWKQNGGSPRFDDRKLIGSAGRDWRLNYVEHFLDGNRGPKLLL